VNFNRRRQTAAIAGAIIELVLTLEVSAIIEALNFLIGKVALGRF